MKVISKGVAFIKTFIKKVFYFILHPRDVKTKIDYYIRRKTDDRIASQGHYLYPHHIIFLAGMALGGSTWMKNLLARIPGYYTRRTPMPWIVAYNANICDSAFHYTPKNGYTLFKTHLNPSQENLDCITRNGVTKILITYRDFRDVALSRCHRLIEFPKSRDAADFVDYKEMGFEKALEHSINHIAEIYVSWIKGWKKFAEKDSERYCFIRFEDMKADTHKAYMKVLNFYEIELPEELIQANIEAAKGKGNVKDNIQSASVLPWGVSSNFRSGRIGSWKKEFSQVHIDLAKEKIGQALIDYDYEHNLNW